MQSMNSSALVSERKYVFSNSGYKDPGGPAQLGTRDWAGLKRHGADRDLARYGGQKRAAPGEFKSHARRHRAPKSGTWVGYNWV